MGIPDIIAAKRDGRELAEADISRIVLDYAAGTVPDYQMSAFLMAVCIRGMNHAETLAMTHALIDSGRTLDLSSICGVKVDKHSTGGVGDKTTLLVVPLLASCGLKVPKMSGRGLGFTGGTLDKLESIPGFSTALTVERFVGQVGEIGAAMAGQSRDIVPADKKIYALRDVTATVDSVPLIAASVMSKKIACGSDVILLDVKTGSGAFARSLDDARELARTMIAIGEGFGRTVAAAITDMSQPLGRAVGNAIEVAEAVETLSGGGPEDFRSLCIELSSVLLRLSAHCASAEEGREAARAALDGGAARAKFAEIVSAQGGDPCVAEDASVLPRAEHVVSVTSEASGYVAEIDTAAIGAAASLMGAGRQRIDDRIDPAVGLVVNKRLEDRVEIGEPLAHLHYNDPRLLRAASTMLRRAFAIADRPAAPPPLIHELMVGTKTDPGLSPDRG